MIIGFELSEQSAKGSAPQVTTHTCASRRQKVQFRGRGGFPDCLIELTKIEEMKAKNIQELCIFE